jgi:Xaa-Pro aminopeptidase
MSGIPRDKDRIRRIQIELAQEDIEALICTLPSNVLLLSGYWPVVGTAIAIVTREGAVAVLAPDDECEQARLGWADEVRTFQGGSLDSLQSIAEIVRDPLTHLGTVLNLRPGVKIGLESDSFHPSGYASTFVYGESIRQLLEEVFPLAVLVNATDSLDRLRAVLTPRELGLIRQACAIARQAFVESTREISAGMREFELAAQVRVKLISDTEKLHRSDGFAFCMSGPNSAQACAAYQQTASRQIGAREFILVHCNSYYGGFWTDITRTFCLELPDSEMAAITNAVLEASRTAIAAVRPGVKASVVDHAARQVLEDRGFGPEFKHATGHGVGFAAINHNARPRIHPISNDVLEPGMVFNIEPAFYRSGYGGVRQCNMVAVTEDGVELLTNFQQEQTDLILN